MEHENDQKQTLVSLELKHLRQNREKYLGNGKNNTSSEFGATSN